MEVTTTGAGTGDRIGTLTVCQAFRRTIQQHGDRIALRTKGGAVELTWAEYGRRVDRLAGGLAGLGLEHGASIGIQLTNRPEFHIVDMAALHLGGVPFGIYNTTPPAQIAQRLRNADAEIIVTETAFLEAVRTAATEHGGIRHIILVDGTADGTLTLEDVIAATPDDFDLEARWSAVQPNDLCAITYTSGSTGPPKGAEWSHRGAMLTLEALAEIMGERLNLVSYLPLAHAGERMFGHYMPLLDGGTITSVPNPREVLDYLREVRPNVVMMPPRVWDKVIAGVRGIVAAADNETRARFERCLEIGTIRAKAESAGTPVDQELAAEHDALAPGVQAQVLAPFGLDRLHVAVIGAAPSKPETLLFYHALGLDLLEAYGLTECGTLAVINRPDDFRVGTVGKPITGAELKLADDGEILLRSEMNMVGYRKQPAETAETIDADGWLHTGDVGRIDDDGFLTIVDRKKELIINATGKSMSPANIEAELRSASDIIGQSVAVGDGQPYLVGLLTLDPDAVAVFAKRAGIDAADVETLVTHEAIRAEIERAVEAANARLSRAEQIRRYTVLPVTWIPDSEELTPTMKLKRRNILEKYATEIDSLYAQA